MYFLNIKKLNISRWYALWHNLSASQEVEQDENVKKKTTQHLYYIFDWLNMGRTRTKCKTKAIHIIAQTVIFRINIFSTQRKSIRKFVTKLKIISFGTKIHFSQLRPPKDFNSNQTENLQPLPLMAAR